jgi:diguanylate cyclase (GGDEF)-like protein
VHLAVQHAAALAGAAAVAAAVGLRFGAAPRWDDALLTVVVAAAWMATRYGLAALIAQWNTADRRRRPPQRWGIELFATAALLLLGPVVFAAAQAGLAIVPLVLLALHAVHRLVRSAAEFERAARTDTLTGLPNRRALTSAVAELTRAERDEAERVGTGSDRTARDEKRPDGSGRDARRRDRSGRDGSGRDGSGQDGSGRDGSGRDGSGRDGSGRDGSGRDGSGRDGSGRDPARRNRIGRGSRRDGSGRERIGRRSRRDGSGRDGFGPEGSGLDGSGRGRRTSAGWRREGREGRLALLLLDIDRFRNVNDALGHALGDRLLVEVGQRLSEIVPPHDMVVRLGGDEFAVLATRVDGPASARRIAGHLAEALNRPIALDGMPVEVSASIGIAVQPEVGIDGSGRTGSPSSAAAVLLRQAEAAMYDAKQRGDQIAVYGPDAAHHSADRITLLADLRHALRSPPGADGITIFYQPQIAIATGEVVGVEALLRWRHPDRGLVGPEELIRVVEPTPVMRLLTARVLDNVVAQLGAWRAAGRPVRAAVNISVRDLHAPDIADHIHDLLDRYAVPPAQLQLEITESALMADPHRVLNTITRLDRMGVAISLDDFGTGFSSLQHLRRLPLAEVKIDRSFVLGMAADRGDAAIVRSVIDLAEALGLRVVAEGVEDERTWRLLAAAGCHAAQGWFHARPMPAEDLAAWLARYRPVRPGVAPIATG